MSDESNCIYCWLQSKLWIFINFSVPQPCTEQLSWDVRLILPNLVTKLDYQIAIRVLGRAWLSQFFLFLDWIGLIIPQLMHKLFSSGAVQTLVSIATVFETCGSPGNLLLSYQAWRQGPLTSSPLACCRSSHPHSLNLPPHPHPSPLACCSSHPYPSPLTPYLL